MLSASENMAPTSTAIPTMNGQRKFRSLEWRIEELLEFEYGYSSYVNIQTLSIQEMPERAPFGQVVMCICTDV